MDIIKRVELLRKRNQELSNELNDTLEKLGKVTNQSNEKVIQYENLIIELDTIKTEWNKTLTELKNCKIKYDELISELKDLREIMFDTKESLPWYKKIFHKR